MTTPQLSSFPGYDEFLYDLKDRIRGAQVHAAFAVNRELVLLYWEIGRHILARQERHGWGARVVDKLGADLGASFPGVRGFSARNLKYTRSFARSWPDPAIVQEALAQITWYHNLALLEKLKSPEERLWYARATLEYGWSRNILVHQIESGLHRRQGQALTNFERTLPTPQSELAQQVLKDPYSFDFLTLGPDARERDLERRLLVHVREFLLELGIGFAFVGSQYRVEVGERDFYLDLLFYHLDLRCFVVIDLKMQEFEPEFAGKMNFYLSAVDDQLRRPADAPSIGIILCKTKSRVIVEYALQDTKKPIGVSEYRIVGALPEDLRSNLPTIEQLEAELLHDQRPGPSRL